MALWKVVYKKESPIYITVDTSVTGIQWMINQDDNVGARFAIGFGAMIVSEQ